MAVPHYTYLVLKMPSPAGVLSLQGDLKISHDCDTEAVEITPTNQVPNAMMEVYAASKKLAPSKLDIPEKSDKANKPQPTNTRWSLGKGWVLNLLASFTTQTHDP
jgi:hypothetical protein